MDLTKTQNTCHSRKSWNPDKYIHSPYRRCIARHALHKISPFTKGGLRGILILLILFLIPNLLSASDQYTIIQNIIQEVSIDNMLNTISDLQENVDINFPDKAYRSRYCLRVRDASDPTDGACDNAADYIYNKFASYGLEVEYDSFIHTVTKKSDDKEVQESYRMRNVVATLPGKGVHRDMTYIICSHYDSIAGLSARWIWDWKELPAPGADDNASGTSAVLEAARILSKYEFGFTIKFITFSGEELGMFGSKHYAGESWKLNHKIAGVLNLDMLGYDPDEPDIDIVSNDDSQWLANAINYVYDQHNINLGVNKVVDPKLIYSDHSSFWKSGYSAIMVTEVADSKSDEFSPVNHSPDDTIDKINPDLLFNSSKLIIATLASLADPASAQSPNIDLAITSLNLVKSSSKGITLTADISNLGNEDATEIKAQIWLTPPEDWLTPTLLKELNFDLDAMSSYEITENINLSTWGDYAFIIRINTDFGIFETNFTNNMAQKALSLSEEIGIMDFLIYPNPVIANKHDEVNIRYSLSRDANVKLNIYNLLGKLIYSENFVPAENGGKRGPNNNIRWDLHGSDNAVASGIYICHVTAVDEGGKARSISGKLALIR